MIDEGGEVFTTAGLSLRDFFAALALSGLAGDLGYPPEDLAKMAYELADCMIKERLKAAP